MLTHGSPAYAGIDPKFCRSYVIAHLHPGFPRLRGDRPPFGDGWGRYRLVRFPRLRGDRPSLVGTCSSSVVVGSPAYAGIDRSAALAFRHSPARFPRLRGDRPHLTGNTR